MAQASRTYTNKDVEKYLPTQNHPPDILDDAPSDVLDNTPSPPDILDDEVETTPKRQLSIVDDNAPDIWWSGFNNAFKPGGDVSKAVTAELGGYLKGATLDIPETAWNMAKSAGSTFLNKMRGDSSGLNLDDPGMSIDFSHAGDGSGDFGRQLGQITGQPLTTAGLVKASPSLVRGAGAVTETIGRGMRKHTPITGLPLGQFWAGRTGRNLERGMGRGLESVGQSIRNVGRTADDVPMSSIADDTMEAVDNVPIAQPSIAEQINAPEVTLQPQPKLKLVLNRDGTYTNKDTGEIITPPSSKKNPTPIISKSVINKELPSVNDRVKGHFYKMDNGELGLWNGQGFKPPSISRNSPLFKKNRPTK